ncbi:hypothetical protein BKI52_29445 [marine bacterium AO1-C]|nr:hypothetical protein BKI52_29445 [marine bacterium AO1-C]
MKTIFLSWLILLTTLTTAFAQTHTFLVPSQPEGFYLLGEKLEVLEDTSSKFTYPLVKKHTFVPLKEFTKKINQAYAYWGRLTLKGHLLNNQHFILFLGSANYCKVFIENGARVTEEYAGRLVPLSQKKIKEGRNVAIPISFSTSLPQQAKQHQITIYFRFKNIDNRPPKFNPALYTQFAWYHKFKVNHLKQIGFLTLLWTLVIYQLTLFILTRKLYYLHSLLCFFILPIFFLATSGILTEYVLGEHPKINEVTYMLALGLLSTIYPMLNRSFVNTAQYFKIWDKVFSISIFLSALQLMAVVLLLAFNFNLGLALKILIFGTIPPTILNPVFAIQILRKNIKDSKIYAIGILQLSVFFIINLGQVVLNNTSANDLSLFMLGLAIQGIFFTVALAQRMKIAEEEKHEAKTEQLRLIAEQNDILEWKVRERTLELNEKTLEILAQNEELQQQQEEIETQRDAIAAQHHELFKKNQLVAKSIHAAQTIQQAILPYQDKLNGLLKDYFIIYRPKDVVSGDFYWLNQIDDVLFLATVDCTGHGVPGAFMSLIGNMLLDKIINVKKEFDPATALQQLHDNLLTVLQQERTRNHYGMEMSLLAIKADKGQHTIQFCGAKHSLHYISSSTKNLRILKGDRKGIGGLQPKIAFTTKEITLPPDSLIYLGSDGLEDQNNIKRKKFGSQRVLQILSDIAPLPLIEQKKELEGALDDFMKGTSQRDDIMWMGCRL